MDDERQKKFKATIEDKPEKFGYSSGVWSGPLVIDYIQSAFGVSYKKAQIRFYFSARQTILSGVFGTGRKDRSNKKNFACEAKTAREIPLHFSASW